MNTRKILFLLFLFATSILVNAQEFSNTIFSSKVKSIQLYKSGNDTSTAVIQLLGNDVFVLEFDILNSSILNLRYEIFLCDKQWHKSNLLPNEFSKSIGIQRIESTQNSVNTSVEYVHYQTEFPNQDFKFLLSGNYIVQVYNDDNGELLFQKRCMVIEQIIKLDAIAKQATDVEFMDTHQEIDVFVTPLGFPIPNKGNDLTIQIMQNGRWDNCLHIQKPSHITTDKISFDFEKGNLFEGGSEFHQFNFKNVRYFGEHIQSIDWIDEKYVVNMRPNTVRTYKTYVQEGDLNGAFVPAHEVMADVDFVGDYALVNISLPYYKQSYDTLDVYVVGGFNHWILEDENKMIYNNEKAQYQASITLKQGYYDYTLAQVSKDKTKIFTREIDGSYYQTENKYEVFVYFYDIILGYDRIIGYKNINSKRK